MSAQPPESPPSTAPAAELGWFQTLLENSQDIITILSAQGRILFVSPATQAVLGYRPAELIGRSTLDLIHPEDLPVARERLTQILEVPGAVEFLTYRFRHRDGSWRYLEGAAKNLLHDSLIGGLVVNSRDVTERVNAAEAIQAAKEEAERASRAKNEFLSRVSHELRTPLNAILGFAQLLEMEEIEESRRESVEQILKAGRHLLHLINEVLEISRIEEGRFALSLEPVLVGEAARQAVDLVRPLAIERDLRLHADLDDSPPLWVTADLHRMRQVLLNLLSNAIKYNRPHGEVRLACEVVHETHVRILVRDSGIGIPPERLSELFVPFERLGVERIGIEGTGLGLALSKRLAEAMGGVIGVRSEVGVGSTFWIELPVTQPLLSPAQPGGRSTDPPGPSPSSAREVPVLYIEDNPSNLRLMESVLTHRPQIRLLTAREGFEGLALARQLHPAVILLDLNLPDLSGEEVMAGLRRDPHLAHVPVVLITADATPIRSSRLRDSGACALLTKPLDVRHLLHILDECLPDVD